MQTNELHEFAGCRHGDLVGTLRGYLGHRTACAGLLLPPLEGLLPFLGFVPLGFLHHATSPTRLHRPGDTSGEHVVTLSRTRRVYLAWSQEQHGHSVMPGGYAWTGREGKPPPCAMTRRTPWCIVEA